ncbi:MAG: fructosamine kinase family protein [Spirochaetaceae bacterium]|nr:MAG: fructosamine kinase family protein [Spirochaetaceae bacterium]
MVTGIAEPAEALKKVFGNVLTASAAQSVSGGSISRTGLIELSDGRKVFIKQNGAAPRGIFSAEAQGLDALRAAAGPRVPEPLALYEGERHSYLLMEYIESGRQTSEFWDKFGFEMAELHRSARGQSYGFSSDNFIGSTPQANAPSDSWIEFFGERRLRFQIELAEEKGRSDREMRNGVEQIIARLPELLPEPEHPALLHGDFWGGNFLCDTNGAPVILDPAVYYGHREADLAMAKCFGGFSPRFFDAYNEAYPLVPGYRERVDLYNLYHMLNHLNIFGSGYAGAVRGIIRRYRST